jgi:hypothetical protein
MISAGNRSCRDLLKSTGADAEAMALRIVELPFDTGEEFSATEMEALKSRLVANAGHAGHRYLTYLMRPGVLDSIKESIRTKEEEIIAKYGFQPKHRYYFRFLAAIWSAGEILAHLDLIEFSPLGLLDWLVEQIRDQWKEASRRKGETDSEATARETAIDALNDFLSEHHRSTLVVNDKHGSMMMQVPMLEPRDKLLIRKETDTHLTYIYDVAFNRWLIKSKLNVASTVKTLRRLGIFDDQLKTKDLGLGTYHATGRTRNYLLYPDKFDEWTKDHANVLAFADAKQKRDEKTKTDE